ncbi:MAG: hypothetical protein L3J73_04885 [Thermoplasmata archaeon]|nr:hypothetical protein [Thermoplasmata archaeon]
MSGWLTYIMLTLSYTWGGAAEVSVSPETLAWSCPSRTEVTTAPLELTWSPADGFGAKSSVSVSQYAQHPIYCDVPRVR